MAKITKTIEEFELKSGKTVNIDVTVTGIQDPNAGITEVWIKESWKHETDSEDELGDEDLEEISEHVEDFVQSEDWDFSNAAGDSDSDFDYSNELFENQ